MFQEFPKMVYKGEAHKVVDDADQEAAARADGWHDFGAEPAHGAEGGTDQAEPKTEAAPKQTRTKKQGAEPAQGAEG